MTTLYNNINSCQFVSFMFPCLLVGNYHLLSLYIKDILSFPMACTPFCIDFNTGNL
jgi:hypothetical protein